MTDDYDLEADLAALEPLRDAVLRRMDDYDETFDEAMTVVAREVDLLNRMAER